MKKFIILIRKSGQYIEIYANKKYLSKTKKLGKCILMIANHLVAGRITNYEVYAYEKNRQKLIKGFDAQMIVDYSKSNKDCSILANDEDDFEDDDRDRRRFIDDDEDDDDDRYEFEDDDDDENGFRHSRFMNRDRDRPQIRRHYTYTSRGSDHDIEKIKDNLRNLGE